VNAQQGLIRVSEGQFVDDACNPFYFSGYNTWEVTPLPPGGPMRLTKLEHRLAYVTSPLQLFLKTDQAYFTTLFVPASHSKHVLIGSDSGDSWRIMLRRRGQRAVAA